MDSLHARRAERARRGRRHWLLALLAACGSAAAWAQAGGQGSGDTSETGWAALRDGAIVLFRHAEAPGGGDPPGMQLGDCRSQRNLDEAGRMQARRIGAAFRARGVKIGAVLSSQWCRTRDTAELAFPGQARDEPRFNSFFGDRSREPAQTAAAKALLAGWRGPGVLVVVTHQVNVSALTGVFPTSGEGVVVQPQGDGIEVLGRVRP